MPKCNTVFAPGQYYHIYNRGSGKQKIFREAENYHYLLQLLKKYTVTLNISIIVYCLLPNHYHFLLRQDGEISAGLLVQRLFNRYSKAFNLRYGRTGALFEGPYKSIHIDKDTYLFQICRYIHANPVKADLVKHIEDWPYSNYLEWIGKRQGSLVDQEFIEMNFTSGTEYARFVQDYIQDTASIAEEFRPYLFD